MPKNDGKPIIASSITIRNSRIEGKLNLQNSIVEKQAFFDHTIFQGYSCFIGVQFKNGAIFRNAKFCDGCVFNEAGFGFQAIFEEAEFQRGGVFFRTQFNSDALFSRAKFGGYANFNEAQFKGNAHFWGTEFNRDALFDNAIFNRSVYFWKGTYFSYVQFDDTQFNGDVLTFEDAIFDSPIAQENACRKAKNILEKNGNREAAGDHFYREMEAKRRQKTKSIRYIEFFLLQMIFGYGVHPWRLMYWWLVIVMIFANIYTLGNGIEDLQHWYDPIKISFAIAIAPGYIAAIINPANAGYKLQAIYQGVAIIETIVGTFLWAGFIATFAKKYMK